MESNSTKTRTLYQIGIWLDNKEANIITKYNDRIDFTTLPSGIDPGKPKGGHRSKTPYGPVIAISESKHMEKRKHQFEAYFKSICDLLKEADEIMIMGPAEAKIRLRKYLSKHKTLEQKLKDVQTVDSITDNQKIEKVKEFFSI